MPELLAASTSIFASSDFVLHPRVVGECVSLALSGCDAVVVMNLSDSRPSVVARG